MYEELKEENDVLEAKVMESFDDVNKLLKERSLLKRQNISMKKSLETIKKHNDDIDELKKPITNKDTRCLPFDVKVNVNYILELMEIKEDEIDFDDYELWDGFDEQVKENLMIELAQCIDGYINEYCNKPSHQLWNEYLVEEFCGDVDRLLQDDYFSQYIKYEETE